MMREIEWQGEEEGHVEVLTGHRPGEWIEWKAS